MRKSSRGDSEEEDPYSTGDFDAHAWTMMIPTIGVNRMVQGGMRLCKRARIPWLKAGLPVMSMDGTAVKEVYPRGRAGVAAKTAEYGLSGRARFGTGAHMPHVLRAINSDRRLTTSKIKFPEEDNCYVFVLQSLLLDGVVSNKRTTRELFYTTQESSGVEKYGARYTTIFSPQVTPHMAYDYGTDTVSIAGKTEGSRSPVSLLPARLYTDDDCALAASVMGRFVPIPPYKAPEVWWDAATASALSLPVPTPQQLAAAQAAVQPLLDRLKAHGVRVGPWSLGDGATPVAISHADLTSSEFVDKFAAVLASDAAVGGVCLRAESVQPGMWEAHVRIREH